jgi:predicted RNase H-like HicB family nuclease
MADTKSEVETLVYEAIRFHIEGLIEEHLPVPEEHETFIETMVIA